MKGVKLKNNMRLLVLASVVFFYAESCSGTMPIERQNIENERYSEQYIEISNVLRIKSDTVDGKRHFVRIDEEKLCSSSIILIEIEVAEKEETYPIARDFFSEYVFLKIEGVNDNERFVPPSFYYGKQEKLYRGEKVRFSLMNEYGEKGISAILSKSGWYKATLNIWPGLGTMEESFKFYFFDGSASDNVIDERYLCKCYEPH